MASMTPVWRHSRCFAAGSLMLCIGLLGAPAPAAAGILPRALPRLILLQDGLTDLDPGQFMVAVRIDQRVVPAATVAPHLRISIQPANPGAFPPLDESLEMRAIPLPAAAAGAAGSDRPGGTAGNAGKRLPAAAPGQHWLIYALTTEAQTRLRSAQSMLRGVRLRPDGQNQARVSLEIEQQALASSRAALASSHWETWLQSSDGEGFYQIWSGTLRELLAESRAQR